MTSHSLRTGAEGGSAAAEKHSAEFGRGFARALGILARDYGNGIEAAMIAIEEDYSVRRFEAAGADPSDLLTFRDELLRYELPGSAEAATDPVERKSHTGQLGGLDAPNGQYGKGAFQDTRAGYATVSLSSVDWAAIHGALHALGKLYVGMAEKMPDMADRGSALAAGLRRIQDEMLGQQYPNEILLEQQSVIDARRAPRGAVSNLNSESESRGK